LEESAGDYAPGGSGACTDCHDQPRTLAVLKTSHGVKGDSHTPFAAHGCESCHGPSASHAADEDVPAAIGFGDAFPTEPQNAACLNCHRGGERMLWNGSVHDARGVACASCHDIHKARDVLFQKDLRPDALVRKDVSAACYDCHPDVRAQTHRVSSHPIKEGEVTCNDCHNVHGSTSEHLLVKRTVNQTCYQCHAEKRGPFLWEHQPARDDCLTCHAAHGSTQRALLKQRAPWLCQECHSVQFHPSTDYTAAGLPGGAANRNLLLRSCMNCHTEVHGSNHPSGVRLTR
jgi:DmsE family decaheme c-type cytochrome